MGLTQLEKARRDEKDLAIINANADRLNEEAEDVLGYQEWAGQRERAAGVSEPWEMTPEGVNESAR